MALAAFKMSRGWQDVKLDLIEPHLEQEAIKRRQAQVAAQQQQQQQYPPTSGGSGSSSNGNGNGNGGGNYGNNVAPTTNYSQSQAMGPPLTSGKRSRSSGGSQRRDSLTTAAPPMDRQYSSSSNDPNYAPSPSTSSAPTTYQPLVYTNVVGGMNSRNNGYENSYAASGSNGYAGTFSSMSHPPAQPHLPYVPGAPMNYPNSASQYQLNNNPSAQQFNSAYSTLPPSHQQPHHPNEPRAKRRLTLATEARSPPRRSVALTSANDHHPSGLPSLPRSNSGETGEGFYAATTLTGLSRPSLSSPPPLPAIPLPLSSSNPFRPSTPPAQIISTTSHNNPSSDAAAELMLFLAASPSPAQVRSSSLQFGDMNGVGGSGMKGRRLFSGGLGGALSIPGGGGSLERSVSEGGGPRVSGNGEKTTEEAFEYLHKTSHGGTNSVHGSGQKYNGGVEAGGAPMASGLSLPIPPLPSSSTPKSNPFATTSSAHSARHATPSSNSIDPSKAPSTPSRIRDTRDRERSNNFLSNGLIGGGLVDGSAGGASAGTAGGGGGGASGWELFLNQSPEPLGRA